MSRGGRVHEKVLGHDSRVNYHATVMVTILVVICYNYYIYLCSMIVMIVFLIKSLLNEKTGIKGD